MSMRKPKLILLLLFLMLNISLLGQDIVYDTLIGNRAAWKRVKEGSSETFVKTYYENMGFITGSKILMAAGIWDGLTENVDYKIYYFNYDTITYEFKSDVDLNLILYRYNYTETYFYNFLGLRKSNLGDNLFDGKYLIIYPITQGSQINVFQGIGKNRTLFLSVKPEEVNDNSYQDYQVGNEITFQVINGEKRGLSPIAKGFVPYEDYSNNIVLWPNPVSKILNVKFLENQELMVRIYSSLPLLMYEKFIDTQSIEIDVSSYKSGVYVLIISDYKTNSIIHVSKIVII